jgi:hypothetical protein
LPVNGEGNRRFHTSGLGARGAVAEKNLHRLAQKWKGISNLSPF